MHVKSKDGYLSSTSLGDLSYVRVWMRLAVANAFVNACLDSPSDSTVPYFAASNRASAKTDEHLNERRAASEAAVTKLARFSGSKVGES